MDIHSEEDLIQKHRKERKELQAKIQSIKKTADKKKKKESMQLIAQLESDLKDQQDRELDNFKNNHEDNVEIVDSEKNGVDEDQESKQTERITKAQRRRNKKSEQEKENQRRIAEQDVENEVGPRNMEMQSLNKILNNMNLSLFSMPSNGDCLYQAIRHQLQITNRNILSVSELRKETAEYMLAHRDDMIPFMLNEEGDLMTEQNFEDYCNAIAVTNSWGGHVELTALSTILKCPIHVLQAVGPTTILGEYFPGPPLILTYHRHMYGLGEHYNSTIEKITDADEEL